LRRSGWLLVLAWLVAMPGVLPLLFAAAAWIDGEHGVLLRGGGEEVAVVLTHGAQNLGKLHEQIHHHRLLGRVLTCCATSPAGQPDHVMQFRGTNAAGEDRQIAATPDSGDSDFTVPPLLEGTEILVVAAEERELPNYRLAIRCSALLPPIPGLQHSLLI
jgi:hypothetical protein